MDISTAVLQRNDCFLGYQLHSLHESLSASQLAHEVIFSTCSAAVGARSWFLFSKASLKALSSAAGFTRGKAISH